MGFSYEEDKKRSLAVKEWLPFHQRSVVRTAETRSKFYINCISFVLIYIHTETPITIDPSFHQAWRCVFKKAPCTLYEKNCWSDFGKTLEYHLSHIDGKFMQTQM